MVCRGSGRQFSERAAGKWSQKEKEDGHLARANKILFRLGGNQNGVERET